MSSDEEVEIHIPFNERVQLNRASSSARSKNGSFKPFKSSRKKNHTRSAVPLKFLPSCSKDSSNDQWVIPETPSPYFLGSKKRQNGDKNEQVAKSKRTCLSDRFLPADWTNSRKNSGIEHLSHSQSDGVLGENSYSGIERTIDETNIGSDFDSLSPGQVFNQNSESSIPLSSTEGPSSSLGSSSSATNEKPLTFRSFGKKEVSFDDVLSQPSTSKFRHRIEQTNNNSHKFPCAKGVRFVDSDDETRSTLNSTLKGGQQSANHGPPMHKVIGRGCRKILDSDDSSDNDWHNEYRRPAKCLSSDSDDSSDFPIKQRKKQFSKYSLSRLSSTDSNDSNPVCNISHNLRNTETSINHGSLETQDVLNTFENTYLGEHSYASPDANGTDLLSTTTVSTVRSPSTHGGSTSTLHGRTRFIRHKGSRRSISPHPRILSGRTRYAGLTRLTSSQFSPQERQHCNLATDYPDLFDAEDSSEVEFFTANSYSDTETSGESLGAVVDLNDTQHRPHNNTVTVSASSEDEISVIFSGNFMSDRSSRSGRSRGSALRRRRTCVSGRSSILNPQDLASTSPDPVEQVRQVEEDERFARMLQAEFDAEVTEAPMCLNSTGSDTDSAVAEPFIVRPMEMYSSIPNRLEEQLAPANTFLSRERMESFPLLSTIGHNSSLFLPVPHSPSRRVRGRPRLGVAPPGVSREILGTSNRRRRGRRNFQIHHGDPWMWQFARVLGLGPTHHHSEQEESDYEALLHLAESVGEVIPRGLRKTEINRLPTRKFYFSGAGASSSHADEIVHKRTELNKECQVCLCDYENGDLLRILPCFHEFHTPCIDPWLKINHTCPVCRVEVTFDD